MLIKLQVQSVMKSAELFVKWPLNAVFTLSEGALRAKCHGTSHGLGMLMLPVSRIEWLLSV